MGEEENLAEIRHCHLNNIGCFKQSSKNLNIKTMVPLIPNSETNSYA